MGPADKSRPSHRTTTAATAHPGAFIGSLALTRLGCVRNAHQVPVSIEELQGSRRPECLSVIAQHDPCGVPSRADETARSVEAEEKKGPRELPTTEPQCWSVCFEANPLPLPARRASDEVGVTFFQK